MTSYLYDVNPGLPVPLGIVVLTMTLPLWEDWTESVVSGKPGLVRPHHHERTFISFNGTDRTYVDGEKQRATTVDRTPKSGFRLGRQRSPWLIDDQ